MGPDGVAPLGGVRVIEVGEYVAGPFAALMLADLGADVVKVERPGAVMRSGPLGFATVESALSGSIATGGNEASRST